MFDLTGDNLLTKGNPFTSGVNNDVDYLVRRILATEYGDTDLNQRLNDGVDQNNIDAGKNGLGVGWAFGDFDGDDDTDSTDQSIFDFYKGVNPTPIRV